MTDPEHQDQFADALKWMQSEVHQLAIQKGWWDQKRDPLQLLFLIMTELAECGEAFRNPDRPHSAKIPAFSCMEEELADIVIRTMDMAEHYGYDLGEAIIAKHEYNKSRPHRHGGKLY